ncbi:MAG: hypothetical protein NVS4B7_08360 [Ktedonobacteraceae bacterium]
MSNTLSATTATYINNRRQAYTLLIMGILFLLVAWLLRLNPLAYPIGILVFGAGMLVAAAFNPHRLMISGIMTTFIGAALLFAFKPLIPDGGSILILAIGLALAGVALAARRGYVGAGALTPALIVIFVGLIEYGPTGRYLPNGSASFLLSLWFPGIGLLAFGIIYLLTSSKRRE